MSPSTQLWRSTALMVLVTSIWLLVSSAALVMERQAAVLSAILLTVALVVAIGLFPGSFLQRFLDRGMRLARKAPPTVVIALALGSPPIFTLLLGFSAFLAWDNLRFAQRYHLDTGMDGLLIPLFVAGALIGLVFFVRNLATFFRFRG